METFKVECIKDVVLEGELNFTKGKIYNVDKTIAGDYNVNDLDTVDDTGTNHYIGNVEGNDFKWYNEHFKEI